MNLSEAPALADRTTAGAPVIVIGASFGGVVALLQLAQALPPDLPAIVGLVLHVGAQPSILPELLARAGQLPARHPADGELLRPGMLYVAPPNHHLLFQDGRARLSRGPRENLARPAIDPLFRSAALGWGSRATGVVLTGHMDDGTAGLAAIKSCGGTTIVQDPAEAQAPGMPASALANVEIDYCVPLDGLAPLLVRLAGQPGGDGRVEAPPGLLGEHRIFEAQGMADMQELAALGVPSSLSCPDCGGVLTELQEARPLRYRCHTGHAYTALSLRSAQLETAAHTLQASLRALKEREALLRRLAGVSQAIGDTNQAQAGLREAQRVREQAQELARIMEAEPGGA